MRTAGVGGLQIAFTGDGMHMNTQPHARREGGEGAGWQNAGGTFDHGKFANF